jgi:hypothetical protein
MSTGQQADDSNTKSDGAEKDLADYSRIKTLRRSDLKFHCARETVKAME